MAGKKAKATHTGNTRKTTGTSISTCVRPAASSKRRDAADLRSADCERSTPATGTPLVQAGLTVSSYAVPASAALTEAAGPYTWRVTAHVATATPTTRIGIAAWATCERGVTVSAQ